MLDIQVNELTLKAVEYKLGNLKDQAPKVLKKAINTTARESRKLLSEKAQKTYTIKTSKFNKNIKRKNATNSNLQATLTVKGAANQLTSFKHKENIKEVAAKAKILNNSSLKEIISKKYDTKAFVTQFSSGHFAIVQRDKGAKYTAGAAARKAKYGEHADMTKIKDLQSLSDPIMVGGKKVYGSLKAEIVDRLYFNINKEVEKVLKG